MTDSKIQESSAKRMPPNAGKGRKPGVPNRITKSVKESIEAAFQEVGGVQYLTEQAEKNPQGFMSLLGRLLPTGSQLNVAVGVSVDGRESFEAILARAIIIEGGDPGWETRTREQIGGYYLQYQKGEPLPDPLIIGGMPDPFVQMIEA